MDARLPTLSVKVLEVVAGFGLKDAVTLPGNPDAESLTLPVKLFMGAMLTVVAPWAPRAIFKLAGEAERVKVGPAVIVRENGMELVRLAHVPVMVAVNVPVAAVELAVNVSVLLLPVVLMGLNEAVTPLGRPVAEKLTLPLKPPSGLTLMVLPPWLP